MQQVVTLMSAPLFFALFATELDGAADKEGPVGCGVDHLDQTSVKIDFRSESADGNEASITNAENGSDCFVEKPFITVSCLFQDQNVTTGSLGGPDLLTKDIG